MDCPSCGKGPLIRAKRSMPYCYKGRKTDIPSVSGDFCQACGELIVDADECIRVSDAMLEFNRRVEASLVDREFIIRVRKKLELDQRQAAEIFGGDANTFSRYEKGKAKPPQSLLKLLKVLDRHPELLNEVRAP